MYTLYSFGTPNGIKPTIMLEELKQPYTIELIDITKGEQFGPEFLKISPNNKIPAMRDDTNNFSMFESVAMLQYLAEKHQQFLPQDIAGKYQVLQWCFFQAAHVGPMFGQFGHFNKYAPEQVPYAQKRYTEECDRLLGVMDKHLSHSVYFGGKDYSIADMAIWPWIYGYQKFYSATIDSKQYPHLIKWYQRIAERPAIKAALQAYDQ